MTAPSPRSDMVSDHGSSVFGGGVQDSAQPYLETSRCIRTSYDPKPIPTNAYDWIAVDDNTYDGAPDSGNRHQIGFGATEAEAIADLMEKLDGDE